MIHARLTNGDFIFGMDAENIRRLTSGQPVMIELSRLGAEGRIIITYAETLEEITRQLEAKFGPLPSAQALPDELN